MLNLSGMSNDIYLIGEVGYDITLQNVIEKVKSSDQSKPLDVHIHSEGGGLYEGVAIYNYLKGLKQEVNTKAVGLVASIASVIFLAGKKRTAYIQNRILIHNPWNISGGTAQDFENNARDLRQEEQKIADIYVSETSFTKDEALAQMQEDKMFTTSQLLDKGFITELKEFKAVAKLDNKNMGIEEFSKEEKSGVAKLMNALGLGKKTEEPKAVIKEEPKNIVVKTADQVDVDFTDREEGSPEVGDKAFIEGAPAEGEAVLMANGDTYTFKSGELTEIVEAEAEVTEAPADDADAKIAALTEENARLKEQLTNKVEKSELQAKNEELTAIQAKHDAMETKHNDLVNKLESYGSTVTVETKIVDQKAEGVKKGFFERASN